MSTETETEAPKVKRCNFMTALGPSLREMLRQQPNHPTYRAALMAVVLKPAPPEADTFEKLVEWVEYNYNPLVSAVRSIPNAPQLRRAVALSVDVDLSEVEYGTARYSVTRSASGEFDITEQELNGIVANCETFAEVVEGVCELIDDDAWDRVGDNADFQYGDYDYEDHDSNDASDSSTDFSRAVLRSRLLQYLTDTLSQEDRDRLGIQ